MTIFQRKASKLYFEDLRVRVSQSKPMQVEIFYTFKNYLYIVKSGFLSQNILRQDLSNILGAFFFFFAYSLKTTWSEGIFLGKYH